MMPAKHVIISSGVTAVFAIWADSWGAVLACFLSGILIDLDHHLDYYIAKKKIPINYRRLVAFCESDHRSRMYLFLHSYEFLFLFWVCVLAFNLNMVWWGIVIGFTTHILCDELANPIKPMGYFLSYRLKKRFDRRDLLKIGYKGRKSEGK